MTSKFLSVGLLALIFIFLIGNANAYTNQETYFACNNCSDCNDALNNNTLSEVRLTASITDFAGICINNPANFTNKTFDCQGFTIDGTGGGYGIYLEEKTGNTIKNCIVTDFDYGIYLYSSSNYNTLTNNTANMNTYYGIYLYSSSNNILTNNTANTNIIGISFFSSSNNNTLTNNTANTNTYGIVLDSSSNNNTLTNNTANLNNESGILLRLSSFNQFSANRLENNSQICTDPYSLGYGAGNCGAIHLMTTSTNNTFTDNIVTNNYRHGLFVNDTASAGNIINANTFCSNNQSGGAYYDIYDEDSNTGDNNTCQTTYNYNDTGKIGCTCSCSPPNITLSKSANTTYATYGETINWTITVTNNGYSSVNVSFVDSECALVDVTDLAAGDTANVSCVSTMACADITNTVTATATSYCTNTTQTATATVTENNICGDSICNCGETCSTCSADCGSCPSSGGASHTTPIFFKNFTTELIANQQICFTTYKYNLIVYLDKQNIGVVSENQTFCFTKPSGTYELTLLGGNYNETRFFTVKTAEEPTEPVKPTNDNHCGDGICNYEETCSSCEKDCACPKSMTCKDGVCVTQLYCGDKICNNNETCASCENDCGACSPPKQVPCALFGLNFGKFIVCWYWWLLLFLILPVGYYAYKKYKQNKEK